MGGVSFKMDMDKLMRGMDVAISRAQKTQGLMDAVGETLVSSTQQRFVDGVDPDGQPWKQSKRVEEEGGQTLVDDANLKKSIDYEASSQMVCVGTNKVYGRIHQLGGKAGRGRKVKIDQRAYLGINNEDRKEVKALMAEELKSMFGM